VNVDLIAAAPAAVWSSGAGRLPFGGSRDDPRGFAIYPKPGLLLEDGTALQRPILETHPRWTDDGWIRGEFVLTTAETGQALLARIGFIAPAGPPRTSGVLVTVRCEDDILHYARKRFTRQLTDLTADLSRFAGQNRLLSIEAAADGDSAQTWLVWTMLSIGDGAA
jgi:hypothetical protein